MDRVTLIVVFAVVASSCGCAGARAALPPQPMQETNIGRIEPAAPEPVSTSTNEGKIPADPSTVRASYTEPEQDPKPAADAPKAAATPLPPRDGPAANANALDPIPLRTSPNLDPGKPAALTAAIVGNTVITVRELQAALCRNLKCKPSDLKEIPKAQLNQMAKDTLDNLIERTLIIQEARATIGKKDANWTLFTEHFEKDWKDKELPPLLRQEKVEDEFALARKLEARGDSLDDWKAAFIEDKMSKEMVMISVHKKVEKPGKPELDAYYAKHKNDPKFHREALVTWHEILIPAKDSSVLAEARKKAEAARARLIAGENMTKLAKAESAGATAKKGGLWETSPDGYAVAEVNAALGTLALGQVSPLIQSPKGFHIIRVNSRRKAGAASFVEVQGQIGEAIYHERFAAAVANYLKKLREQTPVSSPLFEGTPSAPTTVEEQAKSDPNTKRTGGP